MAVGDDRIFKDGIADALLAPERSIGGELAASLPVLNLEVAPSEGACSRPCVSGVSVF